VRVRASGWLSAVLSVSLLGSCCALSRASFTTIINAPPTAIPTAGTVGSDTQLNVFNNGTVGNAVRAGSATSTNIEVNISGGTVGSSFQAQHNSTINISGGSVGQSFTAGILNDANNNVHVNVSGGTVGDTLTVNRASSLTMTGGTIGASAHVRAGGSLSISGGSIGRYLTADAGTVVNFSGGTIESDFQDSGTFNMSGGIALNGIQFTAATINISGGSFYGMSSASLSTSKFYGSDWRMNGVPISQLQNIGDIYVPTWQTRDDIISGTLSDGTPVQVFSGFATTLVDTAVPAVGPAVVHAGSDPLGYGIRGGQTLVVDSGTAVPSNFNAGWGSTIQVHAGGNVGPKLQAVGTMVIVDGGTIGNSDLGGVFQAFRGTNVQLTSGSITNMTLQAGSTFNMSGGTSKFFVLNGGVANVTGGVATISAIGGQLNLYGGEMRLDGVPIAGLDHESDSVAVNVPSGSIISGTLADGKPFMYSSLLNTSISGGTLTLHAMAPPPIAAAPIFASAGAVPYGIRNGESLIVDAGGTVADGFRASWGSSIEIRPGGVMGQNLVAVGTNLHVVGGSLGNSATLLGNSTARIEGGNVGTNFTMHGGSLEIAGGTVASLTALEGSALTISGGTITSFSTANHSTVNISGGTFGDVFQIIGSTANLSGGANVSIGLLNQSTVNVSGGKLTNPYINGQCVVNVTGGTLNQMTNDDDGIVNMSGGNLTGLISYGTLNVSGGNINAANWGMNFGSKLNLYGDDMRLDGVPIAGLHNAGGFVNLDIPTGALLSGVLADGTSFLMPTTGYIAHDTVTLHLAAIPDAPTLINVPGDVAPSTIRSAQTLVIGAGGSGTSTFLAGWGSTLSLRTGGSVGTVSAIGARINNEGGAIASIDAYRQSTVTMTGGTLTTNLSAHDASVVNFAGGTIGGSIFTDPGSVVNFMGGTVGNSAAEFDVKGLVNTSGGVVIGGYRVFNAGVANISGGKVDYEFDAASGSHVNFYGTQFEINGAAIPGLSLGTPLVLTTRDKVLTGTLMDGTTFSIYLASTDDFGVDSFSPTGTLTLYLLAPKISGDFNNDGTVDSADYVMWRDMKTIVNVARGTNGDANYDGQVTDADYMIWRAHFTSPPAFGASAAVPEPSAMLLALIGLTSAIIRRR